jgi:hypothetical protein
VVTRHLTTAQFETSPYFQEWAKPIGIVDMIVFFLMHTPMHWSGFGGGRHVRQGIITDREIELGKLFLPHVRRAVTISNLLDIRTIEGARMAEALDALRCAVVLAPVGRRTMGILGVGPAPAAGPPKHGGRHRCRPWHSRKISPSGSAWPACRARLERSRRRRSPHARTSPRPRVRSRSLLSCAGPPVAQRATRFTAPS